MSKRERIRKWCQALESGKYRQARETLREPGNKRYSYCCIGVLERIESDKPFHSECEFNDDSDRPGNGYERCVELLGEGAQSRLISMNDGGVSFMEIADFIREDHLR